MTFGCTGRIGGGGCERQHTCPELWPALGRVMRAARSRERAPNEPHPFLIFLGAVAKAVEASRRSRDRPFTRQVEGSIEPLLASGPVRIEGVAAKLGLSRQTLYRRLSAEGITFEGVLDRLRHRLALRMIRDEGLPAKEAAWRLGFSDPASFSRAFKRWTGKSPRDFRSPRHSG